MAKSLRQSLGGRKCKKTLIPLDNDAKIVAQWCYRHHSQNLQELVRLTSLPYGFIRTWARRDTTKVQYKGQKKRGRAPIIPDEELSPYCHP